MDSLEIWKNELSSCLLELSDILQIETITRLVPKSCTKLILIPYRYLHFSPLHALLVSNSELLFEKFTDGVSYAPSCQILQQIQQRDFSDSQTLFAIQNPTNNLRSLSYANLEVEAIQTLFSSSQVLSKEKATKENVNLVIANRKDQQIFHFACHGAFHLVNPLESNLALAEDESLTLGNLFEEKYSLNRCNLVVLSACETGLIDYENDSDEYIGLPGGFLYAGSSSVVSSLWKVQDISTAFLMIKFYQNLFLYKAVAIALNHAQIWLRNLTKKELQEWIAESEISLGATLNVNLHRRLHKMSDNEKLFKSPFHWAAFCVIGQP
ncbi:MAG: CHAT domain-containing protein [Cyanobacteria bacterium J06650_10]